MELRGNEGGERKSERRGEKRREKGREVLLITKHTKNNGTKKSNLVMK